MYSSFIKTEILVIVLAIMQISVRTLKAEVLSCHHALEHVPLKLSLETDRVSANSVTHSLVRNCSLVFFGAVFYNWFAEGNTATDSFKLWTPLVVWLLTSLIRVKN